MRHLAILALSLAVSSSAFAAPVVHHTTETYPSTSPSNGLTAVGVSETSAVMMGPSATAMFSFTRDWIQTYLGFYQTKGSVSFSVGGAYKFTVAGTRTLGFHVGPGFSLGTVNDAFAYSFFGAAGGHFTLLDRLFFSVDAGPMLTHTENNTNFRLRTLGDTLGASVLYIF